MKMYVGVGESPASRPGRFAPGERAPVTYWIGSYTNTEKGINSSMPRVGFELTIAIFVL
jgi:hypothetical protein